MVKKSSKIVNCTRSWSYCGATPLSLPLGCYPPPRATPSFRARLLMSSFVCKNLVVQYANFRASLPSSPEWRGGGYNKWGRWKKFLKRWKIGLKLDEFKRIGTILEMVEINFSKIINWGIITNWNASKKIQISEITPPPSIKVRKVPA